MGVDLERLSPAPWKVKRDEESGGVYIAGPTGYPMLLLENDKDPLDMEALEFAALARNAFEVMMKRGWNPCEKTAGVWAVETQAGTWVYRRPLEGGDGSRVEASDPFTALVEADRWVRENVEKSKSGVVFLGEEP